MSAVTVYRVFEENTLLYVGCSMYAAQRLQQHSDKPWWGRATRVTLEHFDSEEQAALAEMAAIASEVPRFNVARTGRPIRRPKPPVTTYRMYANCSNCGERNSLVLDLGNEFEPSTTPCKTCGCLTLTRCNWKRAAA